MTATTTLWNTFPRAQLEPSDTSTASIAAETDVCVIGSGIAGLTAAFELTQRGVDVIVISDGRIAGGETAGTTAQINTMHDDNWSDMASLHDAESLKLCAQSYRAAIDYIEKTQRAESIDCGFERLPAYVFPTASSPRGWIDKEYQAALRAGIEALDIVDEIPGLLHGKQRALCYHQQGQFHPLAYCAGLTKAITRRKNGSIFSNSRAVDIDEGDDEVRVRLADGTVIVCEHAIVATNVPFHQRLIPFEAIAPYRSYVIALPIERGSIPIAQYADNENPYHYVRVVKNDRPEYNVEPGYDLLLVGGEDHRVGEEEDTESRFGKLYNWAGERFGLRRQILYRWSAQTIETFDGMPLIGRSSPNSKRVFIITGDSGMGMTHGTLGGLITADLATNTPNPWVSLYDPQRSRTKSMTRWFKENADMVAQYRDWLTPGDIDSEDELLPGHGAILRCGLTKHALFKNEDGTIERMSAVCPHLRALVRWNPTEQTWDCPAHGSRFDAHGKLLHGPAHCDLKHLKRDD